MPQGKGKIRQQAGVNAERENRTTWESIAYTTSNTSIYEILARAKSSAEGEMARCLQLNIEAPDWLTLDWCKPRFSPVHRKLRTCRSDMRTMVGGTKTRRYKREIK